MEGRRRVCVFVLFAHVCVPLVFLPRRLLSHGPNMGPSVQLTMSHHGHLVRQTCGGQMLCFCPDQLTAPSHDLPNPTQGTSSWLVRPHGLTSFHLAPGPLHSTLHALPEVSFFSNLCSLSTILHLGHKQEKGCG